MCIYLQVIRKDLEDCEAHIIALETLVSSNPANRTKFERLFADWKLLYKAVRVRSVLLKVFWFSPHIVSFFPFLFSFVEHKMRQFEVFVLLFSVQQKQTTVK